MRMPSPRGPLSRHLVAALATAPHDLPDEVLRTARVGSGDAVHDEDLQLSLFLCYELHYRGFDDVDDDWEWQPSLLAVRAVLEARFLAAVRSLVGDPAPVPPEEVPAALAAIAAEPGGPPLAAHLQRRASREQFAEFVAHRSVYHLKEADPHTWAIPRLGGRTKAALVEIQSDEYGGGRAPLMHSELFRRTMRWFGLDDSYGAYVGLVPAATLASTNVISMFGLHRRWRGALIGHLAAFEMTSSLPNRKYGNGVRRLGGDTDATYFYDEHVTADAVHEQIAAHDLCGTFAAGHPDLTGDVLFGARAGLRLDALVAEHLLACWARGESSLAGDPAARACA